MKFALVEQWFQRRYLLIWGKDRFHFSHLDNFGIIIKNTIIIKIIIKLNK